MEKYILKVEANCNDQAREAEFNDWYNNIHIPDVLETKGFVRSIRYELLEPSPDKGKYVAVHEIETDDLDDLFARHGANMKKKESLGRITDLITVTSRGIYKQIYSREAKS